MKIQTTLVMLALFAVAVGLYALVQYAELPTAEQREQRRGRVFAGLETEPVDRIELNRAGKRVVLRRQGVQWQITEPVKVLADSGRADEVIRQIEQLRMKSQGGAVRLKGGVAADLSPYGLAEPKLRAALFQGAEQVVGLSLGDEVAGGRFAKRAGEDQFIYVVDPSTLSALERPVNELRQRGLVTIGAFDADSVKLLRENEKIALAKKGNHWQLTQPIQDRADAARVRQLLGDATALKAHTDDDFVDDAVTPEERTRYGLESPTIVLEVRKPLEVSSGEEQPAVTEKVLIGSTVESDDRKRYAMIEGQSYAIAVDAVAVEKLEVPAIDLRSRDLVQLAPFGVDYLRIEPPAGAAPVVVVKPNSNWKILEPKAADADTAAVEQFLHQLDGIQIREFLDDADPTPYGLADNAAWTVSVWEDALPDHAAPGENKDRPPDDGPKTVGAPKGTPTTLRLGKHDADNKRLYAARAGRSGVVAIDDAILATLQAGDLAFRDRKVFDFIAATRVAKIHLVRDGRSFAVERNPSGGAQGDAWRMTEPVDAPAHQSSVQSIVNLFSGLRATKFVSENPEDLAVYGLDAPRFDVTLILAKSDADAPEQQYRLLIGNRFSEPPAQSKGAESELVYAKRTDGDLVFTIPTTKVEALGSELHEHRVFRFAVSDVTTLSLTYPDRILQLQYAPLDEGGGEKHWSFVGEAPFELDGGKIEALVNALARLDAVAFEQYEGEREDRFGLATPALKVEVTLSDGTKKTLELGAAVADGRYAATPALPGAVFRIAELDVTSVAGDVNAIAAQAKSESNPIQQ